MDTKGTPAIAGEGPIDRSSLFTSTDDFQAELDQLIDRGLVHAQYAPAAHGDRFQLTPAGTAALEELERARWILEGRP